MNCKEATEWIDAYVDNELELSRQLEVEQHLKDCAACARLLAQRRNLQTTLRNDPLRYITPPALERDLWEILRREDSPYLRAGPAWRWSGWWSGFVSAAALTSVLFICAPYLARPSRENRLAQEVTDRHVHSLMAHHLTDVESSNQHQVKPWFNGRIDFAPEVLDLSDHGFPLAGGRLDYLDRRPVAALVYHRALHPINLFIWPALNQGPLSPRALGRQGYHLIHWSKDGMAYWVISDLNERELLDFAELVRKQAG